MSKPQISTLLEDIERKVLDPKVVPEIPPEVISNFGVQVAKKVVGSLQRLRGKEGRKPKTIYASEVGKPCHRQTWYSLFLPETAEPLLGKNILKFLYGDILEELLLLLARLAGHEVTDEQKRVEIPLTTGWKITGKMDAKIDGVVVDVKSTSPYGFNEMNNNPKFEDKFGYRKQLSTYALAEQVEEDEPISDPALFMVDKQNGTLGLTYVRHEDVITSAETLTRALDRFDAVPPRHYADEVFTNGNRKLGTACSYCAFKKQCWPGLRAFAYAKGPVFMTEVVTEPKGIPEIKLKDITT